jgi:diaminopimelate epimerase
VTTFVKSHGLGNDYLVLEGDRLEFPLSPGAVRRLCDRHRGIGADGILVRAPSATADFGVRIFNPDGSEAEKSGNGLRIFAKYLREHGATGSDRFRVETRSGVVVCECEVRAGRVSAVAVEMGRVSFRAADVPMLGFAGEAVEVALEVAGERLAITAVSVGNPHCVVFTARLEEAAVRRLGPHLEHHSAFPQRTNVQLARVDARDRVAILIWERGAGYTLASGSSSCAAAAAAVRSGRCDLGPVRVTMPGGELVVDVRADWSVRLSGPVEEICSGTLSPELLAALQAA